MENFQVPEKFVAVLTVQDWQERQAAILFNGILHTVRSNEQYTKVFVAETEV